jgi:hypothetical protein
MVGNCRTQGVPRARKCPEASGTNSVLLASRRLNTSFHPTILRKKLYLLLGM